MNRMHPGSVFLMKYLKKNPAAAVQETPRHSDSRQRVWGMKNSQRLFLFSFFFPTSCLWALRCLIKNLLSPALSKCGDDLPFLSSAVRPRCRDKTSVIWRGNRRGDQYSGALGENDCINLPNWGIRSSFRRYRRYWRRYIWCDGITRKRKKIKPPATLQP